MGEFSIKGTFKLVYKFLGRNMFPFVSSISPMSRIAESYGTSV